MFSESTAEPGEEACTLVGPDEAGHWVVRDGAGQYGGIFANRQEALRYASHEGAAHVPHRDKVVLVDRLSLAS